MNGQIIKECEKEHNHTPDISKIEAKEKQCSF
jgi:hypothetical protein